MGTGAALIEPVADGWLRQDEAQFPVRSVRSSSEDGRYGVEMTIWTDRSRGPA